MLVWPIVSLNSSLHSPNTCFICCFSELLKPASKRESIFCPRSSACTALKLTGNLLLATASCSSMGQNSTNLQPFGNSISFVVVLAIRTGTVLPTGVTTK